MKTIKRKSIELIAKQWTEEEESLGENGLESGSDDVLSETEPQLDGDSEDQDMDDSGDYVEEEEEVMEMSESESQINGLSAGNEGTEGVVKKNKKKSKRSGNNRPTAEELNNLRETESMFHSSLFRLQLNEMLGEVKPKDKHLVRIDKWLKQFESLLLSLKSGKCYELTDQLWCKSVKVPLIQEPFAVNGKFCFIAPTHCKVIGSYPLGTAVGPKVLVDMAVEIPAQCWQRHDNLNHKYQRKRALYLSHISQCIKSEELISEIKFTYFNGNHTKPILLIAPAGKLSKRFRLAVTAYPESNEKALFRWNRFTPQNNNIRSDWLQLSDSLAQDMPTPIYNSSIQMDLNLILNDEYLSKTVADCQQLKDCLILLKIWLKQRELKSEFGFILSLFVCYLLDKHKLTRNSSCYQIFRNTLLSIANSKWDSEGLTLNDNLWQPLDYQLSYFPVVFIDVSGYHNLCWNISIDSYDRLRHESRLTIDCLDSNQSNSFELTFMKAVVFELKYDILLKISVPSLLVCSKVSEIISDITDNCGDIVSAFVGHLVPLCRRIVGQRVLLVEHKANDYKSIEWSTDQLPPHPNDSEFLTFGLTVCAEHAYNNIERGPPADSPEAKDFKDFWGSKSELRRFQDNSICEAVYWDSKTLAQKRQIISRSLEFILTNILDIPNQSVFTTTALLDPLLELPNLKFEDETRIYGTGEEMGLIITHKFDSLAKKLRALEGLPLTVTTVQAVEPVLRATEVFPPLAMNSGKSLNFLNNSNIFDISVEQRVPKYFKPLEVIIQLEGSGKWPTELAAFRRVKASFNLELSQKLSNQFGLICCPNIGFVDVLDEGFIFRVIIGSHKELVLLRQIKTSEGLVKQIESEVANELELKTEIMPKINSALSALSRTHLCYGISCRLAKRWISSQMLSFYLEEMAIDLMIAYIFLNPNPYTVPNSPIIAFLRFLSLICEHNWKISPLIVNLNNELNDQMVAQINASFTKERPKYPPMFITTSYDKQWSKWTKKWPDSVVLNRLVVLAKVAKQTLLEQIVKNPFKSDIKSIFRPDLDIYDLIIHLKSDQITNQIQAIDFPPKYQLLVKEFDPKLNQRMPIIDFDAIKQFIQHLRKCYSDFGLFFYDRFGGREIGVLLKPLVFNSKPFKISALNGCQLSSTADKTGTQNVITNIEAIIEDMSILGQGIVTRVEARTHNWTRN